MAAVSHWFVATMIPLCCSAPLDVPPTRAFVPGLNPRSGEAGSTKTVVSTFEPHARIHRGVTPPVVKTNRWRSITPENDDQRSERTIMHLLISPSLANVIWVGGGSVGLLL